MSHSGLQNALVRDLCTGHDMVIEALEKRDMEALETLTKASIERLDGILTAPPPETPEDYQALREIKDCIDRIRGDLEQKKTQVFSKMMDLKKTRHGLKAYKKK